MRPTTLLALLACLAAPGAVADPYDPVQLDESAMEAIRQGDLETAWILLQRAARIAPYDPRIARNLRALDARRTGARVPAGPEDVPARKAPPQAVVPVVPPEPPALWPPKA